MSITGKSHQEVRNALSTIEDEARAMRRDPGGEDRRFTVLLSLVARLAQIVREEIVQ